MKDDRVFLLHIRDAIARILDYTRDGQAAFGRDTKTQDAVLRQLAIIGEAVKNLSPALREKQPDVPWKRIAGLRDKVIHEYFGVNIPLVWNVVEHQIPELERHISQLLD